MIQVKDQEMADMLTGFLNHVKSQIGWPGYQEGD